jgi:hypothetical protein
MSTTIIRWIAAMVLALVGTAAGAQAQETPSGSDPAFVGLQEKLEQGDTLTVTLMDGTKVKGRFAAASPDGIQW